MVNIKYKSDWRDKYLQHGSWGVKFLLWIVFTIVPFFIPGDFQWYGECCTLCLAEGRSGDGIVSQSSASLPLRHLEEGWRGNSLFQVSVFTFQF